MPELPDVEGFRRELAEHLPGHRIHHVRVIDAGILRNTTPQALGRSLSGRTFRSPRRTGKWLILPTDGPVLLIHSGMTGHPYFADDGPEPVGFDRLIVQLDRGQLRYADLRKLRGVWLVGDSAGVADAIGAQGPDALSVSRGEFVEALRGKRRRLKPALMDQRVLAGLGNMLTDEICWQARVHPDRRIDELADAEFARLYPTMRRVLRTAVRHGRIPALRSGLTAVRNEDGAECGRCGTRLEHTRSGGRATVWCPRCQPLNGSR